MKLVNDLKVSVQLSVVFGILVMLFVFSGGFGILKLDAVQRNLDDIVLDNNGQDPLEQRAVGIRAHRRPSHPDHHDSR